MSKESFSLEEAQAIATELKLNFAELRCDLNEFYMGLNVELEHGLVDPETNVTNDDPIMTGKIALAHIKEFPDYYQRLAKLESEADLFWSNK